ncbi:MAG: PEP-utilizing enzyme [Candidatus Micrarchaeota archaeon]
MEKELRLSEKELVELATAREWTYVSMDADEVLGYAARLTRHLFKEIGVRLGLEYSGVIEMRACEIVEALKNGTKFGEDFSRRLAARYEDSAIVLEGGKITLYEGEELKKYYEMEMKEEEKFANIAELRGTGASPGKAKGKVALVKSITELGKVGKGDVLVAASTMPAFVPAMEKAAAIVTNEGGLLSHAAIVSREFGIPCIVGTKIATKVFKDGEMVEVDAIKGIVRKIFH